MAGADHPARLRLTAGLDVELDEGEGVATVIVPDRQLSLAIGREGQNVRLAAKLTGWRIDIKSASVAEAEKAEVIQPTVIEAEVEAEAVVSEEVLAGTPVILEPVLTAAEEAEPLPALDTDYISSTASFELPSVVEKPKLRFAEDILTSGPVKVHPPI